MADFDPITAWCRSQGFHEPVREHLFAQDIGRLWRLDFAWVAERVALEVEGGAWTQGRHTRGKGFTADMAKYNELSLRGWRLLRCTPQQLKKGTVYDLLERVLRPDAV